MKVAVFGSTGEVGKEVVNALIEIAPRFGLAEILLFGRRRPEAADRTTDDLIIRFEELDFETRKITPEDLRGCHAVLCCLGSTMAKAGVAGLQRVDHDFVLQIATATKEAGVPRFLLCSSGGANSKSKMGPYMRIKGETEDDCKALQLPFLGIFKPGLLVCKRTESRPVETFLRAVSVVDVGGWWSIKTADVGLAMSLAALWPDTDNKTFEEYGMNSIKNLIRTFQSQKSTDETSPRIPSEAAAS